MDNDPSTPSSEDTYSPQKNDVYDLSLQLRLASSVKIDSEPFEKIVPTWPNDIIMSEFWRMMISHVKKHPEHRDTLLDVFRDFIKAYRNEEENHANPFIDYEKRLKWEGMHLKLLAAKTIDGKYSIVEEAAEEGFRFKEEYFAALSITKKLKEMEAKGLLEHAMEELVFVSYFNKHISISRELEQNEREKVISYKVKIEKKYKKLEPFMTYLHQIEDTWHGNDRVSKETAVESVFNDNAGKEEFASLFKQYFNINIQDETGAELAKKRLESLLDKYTTLWYEVNNGVSRNGHKRQTRQPHSKEERKKIGDGVKKARALRNKEKSTNRPSQSGRRIKGKSL